ncbi:Uncharacterized protein TPAR_04495 [Tolypocladium paradoxum]|uniref:DUF2241 domain-containing protein n=1 Tax=Tolypocladium paradoxum TaxID=94208 RepID=A0A2S4KYN6_9HYPO|nr:Uncharacterized protein TPAR_04495 [Tolypocladium paradoxum]
MAYPVPPTNLDAFSSIISGNRPPKGEITIEARAAIIAAVQAGDKKRLIAKRFGISPAAIHRTLERFEKTGQLASRPRSGRPRTKVRKHDPSRAKTGPQPVEGLGFRHVWGPQPGVQGAGSGTQAGVQDAGSGPQAGSDAGSGPQADVHSAGSGSQTGVDAAGSGAQGPVTPSPALVDSVVVDPGETRPSTLLSNLTATLHPTTYVFARFRDPSQLPPMPQIQLFFQEPEGITIVTSLGYARAHRMECFFPCRMISLDFTSSAEVAGHTAVLMARLAARNLGVKPVSGFYHDHLLVPVGREGEAMEVLAAVAEENRGKLAAAQATAAQAVEDRPAETQNQGAQSEEAHPSESRRGEGQHGEGQHGEGRSGQDQRSKDQPVAGQPKADQSEAQETEEEEPQEYEIDYDSEAHQCSEVDDLDEDSSQDNASEEDTPEEGRHGQGMAGAAK